MSDLPIQLMRWNVFTDEELEIILGALAAAMSEAPGDSSWYTQCSQLLSQLVKFLDGKRG